MTRPKVSVIIPCYNAEGSVSRTIESVLAQTYQNIEVIAVDDGSLDETLSVIKSFGPRIKVFTKSNGGPASARNLGIRNCDGEYVAFTDSDCLPGNNWVENLLKEFHLSKVAGVGGKVESAERNWLGEYIDMTNILNPVKGAGGELLCLITANAIFRKDVLLQVGLFDERFRKPGGEELELCLRIRRQGYVFKERKDALVLHYHKQTIVSLFKTISNYGEGHYIMNMLWPKNSNSQPKKLFNILLRFVKGTKNKFHYLFVYGICKGFLFAFLDYCRHVVFRFGYLRAKRKDPIFL